MIDHGNVEVFTGPFERVRIAAFPGDKEGAKVFMF
jgi:hypothetical protein